MELDADIIVTATGLELLFLGGIDLPSTASPSTRAELLAYKGLMLEGVPNLAMAVGLHQRVVDAEVRSDLQLRGPAADHCAHRRVQCMPVNRDPSMATAPLLGLSSGYITRAQDRFPRRAAVPRQMHQSYLADHRVISAWRSR